MRAPSRAERPSGSRCPRPDGIRATIGRVSDAAQTTRVGRVARVVRAIDPALGLLAVIGFVSQLGISVMLPLLPLYATELGAPPLVLGLLTSSFAVTNAVGQLGAGFLSERWGAGRMLSAGLALYGAMNALIATAASAGWLLAWRKSAPSWTGTIRPSGSRSWKTSGGIG